MLLVAHCPSMMKTLMIGINIFDAMKKFLIITTAFAMLFVGCSKELEEPIQNDEPKVGATDEITAIAPAETKTTIEGLNLKWAADDAITVFDTSAGAHEFTIKTGAGTASATFEGSLGGATAGTYALYPHAAANTLAGNAATVVYPDTYEYGNVPAPLLGTNGGENTYTFANVGGVLRIAYSNAPAFATTFEIESTANICGAYTITDVTSSMAGSFTDGAKKVTITDLPGTSDLEFFIPLPAGDYTFTVRLKRDSDVITASQKTVGSAKTIAIGRMKTLGTINLPAATTVSKSISDIFGSEYANGTKYQSFDLDANITVSTVDATNSGKLYSSGSQWRIYSSESAFIKIAADSGYELFSITVGFSNSTLDGLTSGTAKAVSGSYVQYDAGGTVYITSVSATYMPTSGAIAGSTKVATPSITCSENTVTIECATTGASIYYTDNGDAPTTFSTPYSASFVISANKTVKAIAVKDHMQDSDVASEDCVYVSLKCATPTISCTNNYVTITCATEGASIRYTTDGTTTPTDAVGTVYSAPFLIAADTPVKAVAYKAGYSNSDVATADCDYENILATPANVEITDIAVGSSISFKWDAVTNATGYNWIISTKSTYDAAKDDVFTSGSTTSTSYQKTSILPTAGTVYYVYVQATDDSSAFDPSSWGAGHAILYHHAAANGQINTSNTENNVTLSTISWNKTGSSLNGYQNGYAGFQFGSKSSNGSISFTSVSAWGAQATTAYTGYTTVKKVLVWLNKGSGTPSATVTIGGKSASSDGATVSQNTSANGDYTQTSKVTFTPASDGKTGVIAISASTSSKAGYLCAFDILSE